MGAGEGQGVGVSFVGVSFVGPALAGTFPSGRT